MAMTGLDAFDRTLQKTNIWLNDLMDELRTNDRHQAYLALRSVLHAIRDRLTVHEAAELGAQLPMLIRGFYYEGWRPADKPLKIRDRQEFLDRIHSDFQSDSSINPLRLLQCVLTVMARKVAIGELNEIRGTLPQEIAEMWPQETRARRSSVGTGHEENR